MKIDHQNIEECLFAYFEGELPEKEKTELLDFIHHNPEYERDFTLWAQSYVQKGEAEQDYGLTSSLLKEPEGRVLKYNRIAYLGITLLFAGLIAWGWFNLSSDKNKERLTESPVRGHKTISSSLHEKKNEEYSSLPEKKTTVAAASPHEVKAEFSEAPHTGKYPETSEAGQPLKEPTISDPLNSNSEPVKDPAGNTSEPDSIETGNPHTLPESADPPAIINQPEAVEEEKETEKSKRKKSKLPLNLKPDDEFIPVNPNF